MFVKVKQSGALTTIQDAGRYGFQGQGIPVSGAMDPLAMKMANILVGNEENHPVIECIGIGPVLAFSDSVYFAVSGGNFKMQLNDRDILINHVYKADKDDILKIAYSASHRSCVIALAADFDLDPVYGSYATDIKSGIGPYEGRKFKSGDVIPLKNVKDKLPHEKIRIMEDYPPKETVMKIRVIPGPNEDSFTEEGIKTFYQSIYTVSPKSDKMGFRLDGETIETRGSNDILSAGIADGSIQITSQQPILMMKDHAATGGYPLIATVIRADFPKASQLMPGDQIQFQMISIEDAQDALKKQNAYLEEKKKEFEKKGILGIFRR